MSTDNYVSPEAMDALINEHYDWAEAGEEKPTDQSGMPAAPAATGEPTPPPVTNGDAAAAASGDDPKPPETSSDFLARIKGEKNRQTKQQELQSKVDGYSDVDKAKDLFKTNPKEAMRLMGWDMDAAVATEVDIEPPAQEDLNTKEIAELKKERDNEKNKELYNEMLVELKSETKDNENFELLNSFGNHSEVLELIYMAHNEGQELTYQEAAGLVEAEMEKRFYGAYDKLVGTAKFKNKYTQPSETRRESSESPINIGNQQSAQAGGAKKPVKFANDREEIDYLLKQQGLI